MINHRLLKKGGGGPLGPTLNPPMRAIDTVQKVEVHESHYFSSLAKRYQRFYIEPIKRSYTVQYTVRYTVQKVEVHESHYFSSLAKRYLAGEHQVFFLEMCFCLFYLKKHRTSMFPYFKLMFKLSLVTTNTFLMHS